MDRWEAPDDDVAEQAADVRSEPEDSAPEPGDGHGNDANPDDVYEQSQSVPDPEDDRRS